MQLHKKRMKAAWLAAPLMIPHLLLYRFSPHRELIRSDLQDIGGGELKY